METDVFYTLDDDSSYLGKIRMPKCSLKVRHLFLTWTQQKQFSDTKEQV